MIAAAEAADYTGVAIAAITVIGGGIITLVTLIVKALLDARVGKPPVPSTPQDQAAEANAVEQGATPSTKPPALHDRITELQDGQSRLATTLAEVAMQNGRDHAEVRRELRAMRESVERGLKGHHDRLTALEERTQGDHR